jgi:uncharacterized membrane protein YoaK (UPF0700 family)
VSLLIPLGLSVAAEIWAFLWFAPIGADRVRLRTFNRRAIAYLAVLCVFFVGASAARASDLEVAFTMAAIFVSIFVPLYLIVAALFRSRRLSSYHRGGRSTV